MKLFARDSSIWNMLKFGSPRVPVISMDQNWPEQVDSNEPLLDEKSWYQEKEGAETNSKRYNEHTGWRKLKVFEIISLLLITFFSYTAFSGELSFQWPSTTVGDRMVLSKIVDTGDIFVASKNNTPREIISVGYPDIPSHTYGKSVHQTTLINQTFGNSWGKPAFQEYTPPETDFNKVVLTLKTEVGGVQYDRLVNIFIGGVQLWRASTIEPGNSEVYSTAKKDVTPYLSLFKENNNILFQLDNLLNKRLTGEFKVQLVADFYNADDDTVGGDDFESQDSENPLLVPIKPADKVYPLIEKSDLNIPPLVYLPSDKLEVELPKVSTNTSRLRLSIFTSGNAQEEFWYGNVLDKYKNKFTSRPLPGHGPVRIVNVYFNGEKILTQTPEPIIYTGGISPALWSSVVSNNAFDIRAMELDITGLLPVLWESQAIEYRHLEIEISNGLGETGDDDKDIGENWITSANLLTYENGEIESVNGYIIDTTSSQSSNIVAVSPPYTGSIHQVINSHFDSAIVSDLAFKLKNGKTYKSIIYTNTSASINNVQSYRRNGASQNVVHNAVSHKSFKVIEDDKKVHEVSSKATYPFVLHLEEREKTIGTQDFKIVYDIQLVAGRKLKVAKNKDEMVLKTSSFQNGTSRYILASEGNHGTAKIDTNYTLSTFKDKKPAHYYNRHVKAANGTIISDDVEEKLPKGTAVFFEDSDDVMENLLEIHGTHCPMSLTFDNIVSSIQDSSSHIKEFVSKMIFH